MTPELNNQKILVTGAAGDIGRATAMLCASRGAAVIAADLPAARERLADTVSMCGDTAQAVTFDVTDEQETRYAIGAVAAEVGGITGLVNNAGYQGHFTNTLDYDVADFARVLNINVTGLFVVLQATAQLIAEAQTGGSIVNLASMAGVTGAPNMVAYSAAKAAVLGLTRSAARDLAEHDIRVNSVSPAFIGPGTMWERQVALQAETPSIYFADDPAKVADQMIGSIPMRRYGSLDEVAEVIAFLLSPRSSYMTATNTEVTGGSA